MPFIDDVGFKGRDTSAAAASSIGSKARTLRRLVLDLIKDHKNGLTADECASHLNESVLAIRPRVSELSSYGLLVDTGGRRENASGKKAIVWKFSEKTNDLPVDN